MYYPGSEESTALRVAPRRAKFIPSLEVRGFLWLTCKILVDGFGEKDKIAAASINKQFVNNVGLRAAEIYADECVYL